MRNRKEWSETKGVGKERMKRTRKGRDKKEEEEKSRCQSVRRRRGVFRKKLDLCVVKRQRPGGLYVMTEACGRRYKDVNSLMKTETIFDRFTKASFNYGDFDDEYSNNNDDSNSGE